MERLRNVHDGRLVKLDRHGVRVGRGHDDRGLHATWAEIVDICAANRRAGCQRDGLLIHAQAGGHDRGVIGGDGTAGRRRNSRVPRGILELQRNGLGMTRQDGDRHRRSP